MTNTSHHHPSEKPARANRSLTSTLGTQQPLRNRLAAHAYRYTRISTLVLRVCIGLIFCWFGALKFFPGASAAENFAISAMTELTIGLIPDPVCLLLLAVLETGIGLALLTGFLLRWALAAFFLHMTGVFLSLLVLPDAAWHTAAVPTLEGQYVIKNIVLVAAGLHVAAAELTP
ncbi:DoxX family membrane protein [Streptomyces sp. NPDC102282]|uniref:DoxX family membrane protein n=1 Tax=Streptomyces sp. NPDC102282 TaxID=3366154 RepID=UPI0038179BD5